MEVKRVVGIDPSLTSTGLAIIEPGSGKIPYVTSVKTGRAGFSDFKRQKIMLQGVLNVLQPGDAVVMEDFGVSGMYAPSGKFAERLELCGMIKFFIPLMTGQPWLGVQPTQLKKFITNVGSAKKSEVRTAVETILQRPVANSDEADACALAYIGVATFFPEIAKTACTQQQRKTVTKILLWGANPEHFPELLA